jgi:hypothetical protein
MTKQAPTRTFTAGLLSLDAKAKTAEFYLMNTSRNRNNWKVTKQALEEAGPTLIGKPIGMGKDYKIDKHYPDGQTMDSGKFVAFEMRGSIAVGKANLTDEQTIALIKAGKLGPVSVVILPYREECNACGANLSFDSGATEPWHQHECIKKKGAVSVVSSFTFHRVDFVDVPAYPQAGLLNLEANAQRGEVPIALLAAFIEESQEPPTNVGITNKGAKNLSEQKELEQKLATLEQQLKQAGIDMKAAEEAAAATIATLKAELEAAKKTDVVATLQAQLKAIQDEKHNTLVAETLKARKEAGLVAAEEDEQKKLAGLDNSVLEMLKAEALKVASITQKQTTQPRVKYNAGSDDKTLEAAINKMRADLGLAPLKKE